MYAFSLFISNIVVCISLSPTPVLPLLPAISPLVITSLFFVSVTLILLLYIHFFLISYISHMSVIHTI